MEHLPQKRFGDILRFGYFPRATEFAKAAKRPGRSEPGQRIGWREAAYPTSLSTYTCGAVEVSDLAHGNPSESPIVPLSGLPLFRAVRYGSRILVLPSERNLMRLLASAILFTSFLPLAQASPL